jgi:Rrf2 family protein
LHSLNGGGLVRSTRGVDGGFSLARAPREITLKDIFEAFDCPQAPYIPEIDGQYSEVNDRVLAVLKNARSAAQAELQKVTIADLLPCCNSQPVNGRAVKPPFFCNDASELPSTAGENARV